MKNRIIILSLAILLVSTAAFAQERADALLEYKNGNYDKAIEICLSEIERMPRNMDSYVVLGWSYIKKGEFQSALNSGNDALKISRYDARIIEIVAEANYYLGKNLESLKYFEEYTVIAPTGDRIELAYFFMGEIFIRLGEYNHADIAFTTAVYHFPNSARWWSRLGYAREMAEDWQYSLEAYEKALQLNSSFTEAVRGRDRVEKQLEAG
ncbi:MAG: tetratricopeptide repeat protein [Spirochaetales bacterium]|uniref:Tetratricopeptide repeat protein n=1 Tax=Candidatus Thalassospirochaeta sargassi TaxID=3119039 RepID=A0AAJ1ID39_9SPIO|nr:tetratricopeptide repeat protein [Spirochaetales bacterium]